MAELALDAVNCVAQDLGGGQREIDIKNYAKIEKIPGGTIEDCKARRLIAARCFFFPLVACVSAALRRARPPFMQRAAPFKTSFTDFKTKSNSKSKPKPNSKPKSKPSERQQVLRGVMFNKDLVLPGRMRRRIEKPRILLLDCPLEYKKGASARARAWLAGWPLAVAVVPAVSSPAASLPFLPVTFP